MPHFVKTLTGRLGKYKEGADRQCQNDIERRELFELAGDLLGACMDWHSAGFPVMGEGAMTLETPIREIGRTTAGPHFYQIPHNPLPSGWGGSPQHVRDSFS